MIAPARAAAYDALIAVSDGRADLPTALAQTRRQLSDRRDRSLAAEIATGVQRRRGEIDFLIEHFAKREIGRLDKEVIAILRLSAYQLLHLSRVPPSAVVDDGVELTRRAGKQSASGLVNATLRALLRTHGALPLPVRPSDPADRDQALDYLSITCSHPRWLAGRWLDRLGFARAEAWMRFNNEPAPLTLRANVLKTSADALRDRLSASSVVTHRGRFAPDALIVDDGQLLGSPEASSGDFVVQDEASQIVALLVGPSPGPLVLDTCAAPGGKATAIAASLGDGGVVVACDRRDRRIALLRRTVDAVAPGRVRIVQADAAEALPFCALFSTVIVDAPCSGLGTLRRDPDIRWRRQESDLENLARVQRRLLHHAADVVAEGGRLVYATCSTEPEENEDVAEAFLDAHPRFQAVDARLAHPRLSPDLIDDRGHLCTSPDRHGLEGFFGAIFERVRNL